MKTSCLVNFCLNEESEFEDDHPKFNADKNELYLEYDEVGGLITRCVTPNDNVGISFPGESLGKYNALEINGVDGKLYNLEYQIGLCGGSFVKKNVGREEVFSVLRDIEKPLKNFVRYGYNFVQW